MSLEVLKEKLDNHLQEDRGHKDEIKRHIEARVPYKTFGTMIGIAILILGYMATQLKDLNNNLIRQQELQAAKDALFIEKVGKVESRLSKIEGVLSGYKIEIK